MCKRAKPMPVKPMLNDIARFLSRIGFAGGCCPWLGMRDKNGYGAIKIQGRKVWVHRLSYFLFNGPLTPGMQVHHKCHNPQCVNPDHLELATHSDNAAMKRPRVVAV